MNFIPINNSTHYSLLNSISTPHKLVERAAELGYKAIGISDYHSLSGSVEFQSEAKKKGIKPIIGTKIRIDSERYLTLIAKNLAGWKELVKMISRSNDKENLVADKAVLPKERLKEFELSNLIVVLGDLESELYHQYFSYYGFMAKDLNSAALSLQQDIEIQVCEYIQGFYELFNQDSIFVQVNRLSQNSLPFTKLISDILSSAADRTEVKRLAGINSHYINPSDCEDYRLLICSDQKTTFKKVNMDLWKNYVAFTSDQFHLPSTNEINLLYTGEEIENTQVLADLCESYDVTNKPQLPSFDCPNGISEIDYLRQIAREGYSKKNHGWNKDVYGNRAKLELTTIEEAQLAGYFLIVQDYVNKFKREGHIMGLGRGSVCGSLIAYLTGITEIDPIPYDLIFERFYNKGRNTDGNISYPDIDMDFPIEIRKDAIEYVRNKYGRDRVSQICTFGSLQGRSAIREVLRIHESCDMNTINQISKRLPEKHKIADKMEEDDISSIIQWTLENEPKLLEGYCELSDDNTISGEYSRAFEQAIRIEGVYKSVGCHAAGVVISKFPLEEVCPMIYNEGLGEKIAGYEMKALEKAGLIKFDFLGIQPLSKLEMVKQMLKGQ